MNPLGDLYKKQMRLIVLLAIFLGSCPLGLIGVKVMGPVILFIGGIWLARKILLMLWNRSTRL